jgi:hypothetical protein
VRHHQLRGPHAARRERSPPPAPPPPRPPTPPPTAGPFTAASSAPGTSAASTSSAGAATATIAPPPGRAPIARPRTLTSRAATSSGSTPATTAPRTRRPSGRPPPTAPHPGSATTPPARSAREQPGLGPLRPIHRPSDPTRRPAAGPGSHGRQRLDGRVERLPEHRRPRVQLAPMPARWEPWPPNTNTVPGPRRRADQSTRRARRASPHGRRPPALPRRSSCARVVTSDEPDVRRLGLDPHQRAPRSPAPGPRTGRTPATRTGPRRARPRAPARRRLLEDDVGVRARQAERRHRRPADVPGASRPRGRLGDDLQRVLPSGSSGFGSSTGSAAARRAGTPAGASRPGHRGRRLEVPHHRLRRTEQQRASSASRSTAYTSAAACTSIGSPEPRPRAVALEEVDVGRLQARERQRVAHDHLLRGARRGRQAAAPSVVSSPPARG